MDGVILPVFRDGEHPALHEVVLALRPLLIQPLVGKDLVRVGHVQRLDDELPVAHGIENTHLDHVPDLGPLLDRILEERRIRDYGDVEVVPLRIVPLNVLSAEHHRLEARVLAAGPDHALLVPELGGQGEDHVAHFLERLVDVRGGRAHRRLIRRLQLLDGDSRKIRRGQNPARDLVPGRHLLEVVERVLDLRLRGDRRRLRPEQLRLFPARPRVIIQFLPRLAVEGRLPHLGRPRDEDLRSAHEGAVLYFLTPRAIEISLERNRLLDDRHAPEPAGDRDLVDLDVGKQLVLVGIRAVVEEHLAGDDDEPPLGIFRRGFLPILVNDGAVLGSALIALSDLRVAAIPQDPHHLTDALLVERVDVHFLGLDVHPLLGIVLLDPAESADLVPHHPLSIVRTRRHGIDLDLVARDHLHLDRAGVELPPLLVLDRDFLDDRLARLGIDFPGGPVLEKRISQPGIPAEIDEHAPAFQHPADRGFQLLESLERAVLAVEDLFGEPGPLDVGLIRRRRQDEPSRLLRGQTRQRPAVVRQDVIDDEAYAVGGNAVGDFKDPGVVVENDLTQ